MSTGIYVENCDDVRMSDNTFIGFDKAAVVKNSRRFRGDRNVVIDRSAGLSISPEMLQLVSTIYERHKNDGHEIAIERVGQDSRVIAFAKAHGLSLAGLLASIVGLLK